MEKMQYNSKRLSLFVFTFLASAILAAQDLPIQWNTEKLFRCPTSQPLPSMDEEDVKAVLIEGPLYKGEPTRFFAYYALPKDASPEHPVPAMVLVHGGGGSAFPEWVREWVARGFAAISLDTTGKLPIRLPNDPLSQNYANWALLPEGLHLDWGGYERGSRDAQEQWPYCAVSEVILAHSFLRSQEGVDKERIGITGNSWGGFLTLLTAAVDTRFRLAAPLYACGYYGDFLNNLTLPQNEASKQWLKLWDPSHYVPSIKMPLMWYGGAGDICFDWGCVQRTFQLFQSPLYRVGRPAVVHIDGANPYGRPNEVYAFAQSILQQQDKSYPLVEIESVKKGKASARFSCEGYKVIRAELYYTTNEEGKWSERKWDFIEFEVDSTKNTFKFRIPKEAKHYFLNIFTEEGLASSTLMYENK